MLLQLLRIKNLALVEDLEWAIARGFTAITGATGAGKSMVMRALQLLLGERADTMLIRTGSEGCAVEAIFGGNDLARFAACFADCARWKKSTVHSTRRRRRASRSSICCDTKLTRSHQRICPSMRRRRSRRVTSWRATASD